MLSPHLLVLAFRPTQNMSHITSLCHAPFRRNQTKIKKVKPTHKNKKVFQHFLLPQHIYNRVEKTNSKLSWAQPLFMGIWFSTTSSSHSSKPSLDELPESCVAAVMEYMDPPQICKLASLNRTFRGASLADFVWESKLPSNYDIILRKIFDAGSFPSHLGKREIYSRLCSLNTFDDDGNKVTIDEFSSFFMWRI